MDSGWIKLHRKFLKWEWLDVPEMVSLFVFLLLSANHEPRSWRGQKIKRGQVIIGRKKLAKKLKISERTIRTCLTRLKSTNEVTTLATSRFTLITIVNYEEYQVVPNNTTNQATNKTTNDRPTGDQRVTTNKKYKNIKNIKNNIYTAYKEKINKTSMLTKSAGDKIKARLNTFSEEQLLKAINAFAADTWWMEHNSSRGVAWFFHSDDRIDQFLNLKAKFDDIGVPDYAKDWQKDYGNDMGKKEGF